MGKDIKVPFIDLTRFEPGFLEAVNAKFSSLATKAQFIGGEEVNGLELRLRNILGVNHAISCANGTDAIQLALRALGVGRDDKVLVPELTFWATFEAVVNVGADPVTIDADVDDGGVAYAAFEEAILKVKPKAAIIAHLYGWGTSRLSDIRELCREHDVKLLEDGAQCFGTLYRGESIYKDALISTTSFYPAKVLGGAGDGGAVFTNNDELAEKVRRLGNHGRTAHYGYSDVGWNSRLDSLQAAFLNLSLDNIDKRITSRRRSSELYQRELPAAGINVMTPPKDYVENGYCNVCLIWDSTIKSKLETSLKAANIGYANIYPGVMSKQPGAFSVNKGCYGGNAGEQFSAAVLNLPLFPYMTDAELERVLSIVHTVVRK